MFIDKKFRKPRVWSNQELRKHAHLFKGDVVNVSAWKDIDKEGGKYENYFSNASSYSKTNYKKEARGFQGTEGEIFLDLELDLGNDLVGKFDVVFNHTTLEHVYQFRKAFENLCLMTKDIVIIVVPFLQEMHANYGDYWRFTPEAMVRMFEDNKMETLYLSFNGGSKESVYVYAIGSKNPEKWSEIKQEISYQDPNQSWIDFEGEAGTHAIPNKLHYLSNKIKNLLGKS
jgi:hypothetical protein